MTNNIEQALAQWRKDRGITKVSGSFPEFIEEEVQEYKDAIEAHDRIDAIGDIMIFCLNELALEGYSGEQVLGEVIKEITSRKGAIDQETGKWVKTTTSYKGVFKHTGNNTE